MQRDVTRYTAAESPKLKSSTERSIDLPNSWAEKAAFLTERIAEWAPIQVAGFRVRAASGPALHP